MTKKKVTQLIGHTPSAPWPRANAKSNWPMPAKAPVANVKGKRKAPLPGAKAYVPHANVKANAPVPLAPLAPFALATFALAKAREARVAAKAKETRQPKEARGAVSQSLRSILLEPLQTKLRQRQALFKRRMRQTQVRYQALLEAIRTKPRGRRRYYNPRLSRHQSAAQRQRANLSSRATRPSLQKATSNAKPRVPKAAESFCLIHVRKTKNNTHCSISRLFGQQKTLWTMSGGKTPGSSKSNGRRKSRYCQRMIFKAAVSKLLSFGFKHLVIHGRGPTISKRYIFRNFYRKFRIALLKDLSSAPHNGCRPPSVRRL